MPDLKFEKKCGRGERLKGSAAAVSDYFGDIFVFITLVYTHFIALIMIHVPSVLIP
jgi:hypothetical protein